jgi:hypothetical protein
VIKIKKERVNRKGDGRENIKENRKKAWKKEQKIRKGTRERERKREPSSTYLHNHTHFLGTTKSRPVPGL